MNGVSRWGQRVLDDDSNSTTDHDNDQYSCWQQRQPTSATASTTTMVSCCALSACQMGNPEAQAEFLGKFRADSIIEDCEAVSMQVREVESFERFCCRLFDGRYSSPQKGFRKSS